MSYVEIVPLDLNIRSHVLDLQNNLLSYQRNLINFELSYQKWSYFVIENFPYIELIKFLKICQKIFKS